MELKYVLVFEKTVHLCGLFSKCIGPFDTMEDAMAYIREGQRTWTDPDVFAYCSIEVLIK